MWQVPNAQARFGIMTSGKAYLDTRQALADLGLSEEICKRIGLRAVQGGHGVAAGGHWHAGQFAEDLDEILVVEEKRQVLEYQLKEELFSWIGTGKKIPRVVGKFDDKDGGEWSVPQGNWLLPAHYEFSPAMVAIGHRRAPAALRAARGRARWHPGAPDFIAEREQALARPRLVVDRKPWFCSGCPQYLDPRARGLARHGRHRLPLHGDLMGRNTQVFTQMGGEGVPGWARRRSPRKSMYSPTWATAPITTGPAGDPRRRGGQGAHHLQDPVQRRRRHDRRPAGRRSDQRAHDHAPDGRRRIGKIVVVTTSQKYPLKRRTKTSIPPIDETSR